MTPEQIIALLQALGPAVAVYASIRADLAAMRVQVQNLERVVFNEAK